MDLSTGGVNLDEVRQAIIHESPVPIGTVPVYQALESVHGSIDRLTEDDFLHIIEKHCQQGVDYQTIHAGLLIEHLPKVKGRITGIVSSCLLYTSPSPRDRTRSRMPSSA